MKISRGLCTGNTNGRKVDNLPVFFLLNKKGEKIDGANVDGRMTIVSSRFVKCLRALNEILRVLNS